LSRKQFYFSRALQFLLTKLFGNTTQIESQNIFLSATSVLMNISGKDVNMAIARPLWSNNHQHINNILPRLITFLKSRTGANLERIRLNGKNLKITTNLRMSHTSLEKDIIFQVLSSLIPFTLKPLQGTSHLLIERLCQIITIIFTHLSVKRQKTTN